MQFYGFIAFVILFKTPDFLYGINYIKERTISDSLWLQKPKNIIIKKDVELNIKDISKYKIYSNLIRRNYLRLLKFIGLILMTSILANKLDLSLSVILH